MSRIESPARPKGKIRTRARFTPTVFISLIKNFLFTSFRFRVFNYAEAFSSGRPINIYSCTIHLQNVVSCLYKMIHKTIVQSLTLLFTKYHIFKRNDMHMTGYILIRRNFLYDSVLLDLALFPFYLKPTHR